MFDRFTRSLISVILLLILALAVFSLVSSMAGIAYDAGVAERATLSARVTQVSATLTAVK